MDWLEKFQPNEQKLWQDTMLDHSYDYEEWGDAREKLLKLLQNNQRKADEASLRSYISCCAESIGSVHPLPDLAEVVSEFYQKYGMESSKNIPE